MDLKSAFVLAVCLLGGAVSTATAQVDDPQVVAFQPSYSGSCENCQLAGRQLPYWDFTDANYPGANFSGAVLHGARAQRANFSGISAAGANFAQANLNGTNFATANLTGATLTGADCSTSTLSKATMSGADISGTQFIAADLTGAVAENIFGPASAVWGFS